jgi:hypothetical protein
VNTFTGGDTECSKPRRVSYKRSATYWVSSDKKRFVQSDRRMRDAKDDKIVEVKR